MIYHVITIAFGVALGLLIAEVVSAIFLSTLIRIVLRDVE